MTVSKQAADGMMTRAEGIVYRHAMSIIDRAVPSQKSFTNENLQGAHDGSFPLYINSKVKGKLAEAYRSTGWTVEYDDYGFRLSWRGL